MLKLGAVSYLNTKPLVAGLKERLRRDVHPEAKLSFDLPSRLAASLGRGELDIALIPAIEYFRGDGYEIVSNAVIGCRGPVWSVRLLSRVPVEQIKTLAMDEGSRTSQALVQVLLWEQYGLRPQLLPFPIHATAESIDSDALLMIGDRAMHPPAGVYREIWDLGDRWCRWTELPFVFAVWAARRGLRNDGLRNDGHGVECVPGEGGVDLAAVERVLERSRDEGLASFESIAEQHAGPLGLTTADCVSYFARNLHFNLGPGELRGLERFRQAATQLGLLTAGPDGGHHYFENPKTDLERAKRL